MNLDRFRPNRGGHVLVPPRQLTRSGGMELVARVRIDNQQGDGQVIVCRQRNQPGRKRVRAVDAAPGSHRRRPVDNHYQMRLGIGDRIAHDDEVWQVGETLGEGGQAQVVEITAGARVAALKWYRPDLCHAERLRHVSRLAASEAPHAAIVWPRAVVTVPGVEQFGVLLERVPASHLPLSDQARVRTMGWALRRAAALTLCDAVSAMHLSGLIHRDLSPANVLVHAGTGQVFVIDSDNAGAPDEPGFGIVGTRGTAAPELFGDGGLAPSRRTDLHALAGCVARLLGNDTERTAPLRTLLDAARAGVNQPHLRPEAIAWSAALGDA